MALSKRFIFCCLALSWALPLSASEGKLPNSFDGYITQLIKPDQFEIGAYRIYCSKQTTMTRLYKGMGSTSPIDLAAFPVGTYVHVEGKFDKNTKLFVAGSVRTELKEPLGQSSEKPVRAFGVIMFSPELRQVGGGIVGKIIIHGLPVEVSSRTKLLDREGKEYAFDKITTNSWAELEGVRDQSGRILAKKIVFSPVVVGKEERDYLKRTELEIQEPDYQKRVSGRVKLRLNWSVELLADKELHDYVAGVADKLIPAYQKALPAGSPEKVNFRVYVMKHSSSLKTGFLGVAGSPTGAIFLSDRVLTSLKNEDQLAALLAQQIARDLEQNNFPSGRRDKVAGATALAGAAGVILGGPGVAVASFFGSNVAAETLSSTYWIEAQKNATEDTIPMLLQAGYDPREAAVAWSNAFQSKTNNPAPAGEKPQESVCRIMEELRLDYSDQPYSEFRPKVDVYEKAISSLRTRSL